MVLADAESELKLAVPSQRQISIHASIWKGVVWQQWLAHGTWIRIFLSAWLIGVFVLPLLAKLYFVNAFCVVFAACAGSAFGGAARGDGTEEFMLSLPPRRCDLYWIRAISGMIPLLWFSTVGIAAIYFHLPQRLWGLILESGLTERPEVDWPLYMYAMPLILPLTVYSFSYVTAAISTVPALVRNAWAVGTLLALYVAEISVSIEPAIWESMLRYRVVTGGIACPFLLAASALALVGGYQSYVGRDAMNHSAAHSDRSRWWVLAGAALLFIFLVRMFSGRQ